MNINSISIASFTSSWQDRPVPNPISGDATGVRFQEKCRSLTNPLFCQDNYECYQQSMESEFFTPVAEKEITIQPHVSNEARVANLTFTNSDIYYKEEGSVSADEQQLLALLNDKNELANLLEYWTDLVRDPVRFLGYLSDLEEDLAVACDQSPPYCYLLEGKGYYAAGPARPDLERIQEPDQVLDAALLKKEQMVSVNQEGSGRFVGPVDKVAGNYFVASNHLFCEDPQVSKLLLHGVHSHRLAVHVFRHSLKDYQPLKDFPLNQINNLLIAVKINGDALWDHLLDCVSDMNEFQPKSYSFSCRSPFVLNSLIICFGHRLNLPSLQKVLYAIQVEAMNEMIARESKRALSDEERERLYLGILAAHQCGQYGFGDIGENYFAVLSSEERLKDPMYAPYPGNLWHNIKIRASAPKVEPQYRISTEMKVHIEKQKKKIAEEEAYQQAKKHAKILHQALECNQYDRWVELLNDPICEHLNANELLIRTYPSKTEGDVRYLAFVLEKYENALKRYRLGENLFNPLIHRFLDENEPLAVLELLKRYPELAEQERFNKTAKSRIEELGLKY